MEILTKPTSSVEDIATFIGSVEQMVDGATPLSEREDIKDLFWVIKHRTSDAGSQLKMGVQTEEEERLFANYLSQLRRLAEADTLDSTLRIYDRTNNSGVAMKNIVLSMEEVLSETVGIDYEKRLDDSMFEQLKQLFAHRDGMTRTVSVGVSGVATLAATLATAHFLKSGGDPIVDIDILKRGSFFAITAALGAVALGSAKKSLPRKVGSAIGSKVHTSREAYTLDQHLLRDSNGALLPAKDLMERYAERDLSAVIPTVALHLLLNHEINQREDIAPAVHEVFNMAEALILEVYNVDLGESWLQQSAGLLSSDNIDYGFRYKYID